MNALATNDLSGSRSADPTTAPLPDPAERWRQRAIFVWCSLLCFAVLWPIVENFRRHPIDSFPFSHYPMFAAARPESSTYTYVIGERDDGTRVRIPYPEYAKGGMNQARRQIAKVAKKNAQRAEQTCTDIAKKMKKKTSGELSQVVRVKIVTGTFRYVDYFVNNQREAQHEQVHIECPVKRSREAQAQQALPL